MLTKRLDGLDQQNYRLKIELQILAEQQISQTTCQSQTNQSNVISVPSINQSTPISQEFEPYGPYAMCPSRSVDPQGKTISIPIAQVHQDYNNNICLSDANVKFLKILKVMMAECEPRAQKEKAIKSTSSPMKEKIQSIVPKPRIRSKAKTKRRRNGKKKVKKNKK